MNIRLIIVLMFLVSANNYLRSHYLKTLNSSSKLIIACGCAYALVSFIDILCTYNESLYEYHRAKWLTTTEAKDIEDALILELETNNTRDWNNVGDVIKRDILIDKFNNRSTIKNTQNKYARDHNWCIKKNLVLKNAILEPLGFILLSLCFKKYIFK